MESCVRGVRDHRGWHGGAWSSVADPQQCQPLRLRSPLRQDSTGKGTRTVSFSRTVPKGGGPQPNTHYTRVLIQKLKHP